MGVTSRVDFGGLWRHRLQKKGTLKISGKTLLGGMFKTYCYSIGMHLSLSLSVSLRVATLKDPC